MVIELLFLLNVLLVLLIIFILLKRDLKGLREVEVDDDTHKWFKKYYGIKDNQRRMITWN